MTDIVPVPNWGAVRQLETNEYATGGLNGNMNEQAKSLAARSELLKQYVALPYESKTGGYALNERVQLATGDIVRSTIASNVNNPNVNMTGWVIPYLVKSSNLNDVPDKAAARNNLKVMSATEVNTAISNATPPTTPVATETTAGKAKIATSAIAQAGVNDTDIITAKKLRDVAGNAIKPRSWSDVTASRIANTWYSNTTGNDIGVFVSRGGVNSSVSITVRKTGTSTELTLAGTNVGNNLVVSSTGFWEVPDGFDYKISPFGTVMELRV